MQFHAGPNSRPVATDRPQILERNSAILSAWPCLVPTRTAARSAEAEIAEVAEGGGTKRGQEKPQEQVIKSRIPTSFDDPFIDLPVHAPRKHYVNQTRIYSSIDEPDYLPNTKRVPSSMDSP